MRELRPLGPGSSRSGQKARYDEGRRRDDFFAVNEAVPLLKRSSISEYSQLAVESRGVLLARDSAITINGVSRYRRAYPLSFVRLSFTSPVSLCPSRRASFSSG